MKIHFPHRDTEELVRRIRDQLGGRTLGKIVDFSVDGSDLHVTIAKMGKSHLTFSGTPKGEGLELALSREKIALTHRAFRDEVVGKIVRIVEEIGGEVTS